MSGSRKGTPRNEYGSWVYYLGAIFIGHCERGSWVFAIPSTALACHLLRLSSADDVYDHYLRGGLFESMILSDFMKKRYHHGLPPNLYFWRDKAGTEVDCLLEEGSKLIPIEIKSSATIHPEMFESLEKWRELAHSSQGTLVYAGLEDQNRSKGRVVSWRSL